MTAGPLYRAPMLHRLMAVIGYPAYRLNRAAAGLLPRIGLGRVPGSLVAGLAILALAVSTGATTLAAYDARPEAQPSSVSQIADGRVGSGLWVAIEGVLIDGPHVATVEVFGGVGTQLVERFHYLVADPDAPDRAMIVRAREPIAALEAPDGPVALDGTITEDQFNMRSLLEDWDPAVRNPGVEFSEGRLIAYAFETPWVEPSWIGTWLLGAAAALLLGGACLRQPILRLTIGDGQGRRGSTPIPLEIHGMLPTPRGPVRVDGTPAQLEWMNVEEVARTRWRYWGAALGDVRREVEDAVRAHGSEGERLVVHGPSGSVIWPIEDDDRVEASPGDAYLGARRLPAIRVRGEGVEATLTFGDRQRRDDAVAELSGSDPPAP